MWTGNFFKEKVIFFQRNNKSSWFFESVGRISQVSSSFFTLRWFECEHVYITVTSLYQDYRSESIYIRFHVTHVTLRIPCPEICKKCVRVKSWKTRAEKEGMVKKKSNLNNSEHQLPQVKNLWRSSTLSFSQTGKLSDANYRATQHTHIDSISLL